MSHVTDYVFGQTDLCPKDFVWKYELQLTTDDKNNEITVHGYFNLYAKFITSRLAFDFILNVHPTLDFTIHVPCHSLKVDWSYK